jgi:hypothetical protein
MKKILVIFLIPFLFGCEKYVGEYDILSYSTPKLTGGKWILTDYKIAVISSISPVSVIYTDTVCLNNFNNQTVMSNGILMKQSYETTAPNRRFIKGSTTWEFDNSNLNLYCDYTPMIGVSKPTPYFVDILRTNMRVTNTSTGSVDNYTLTGVDESTYPRTMTLVSPNIVTDLYLKDGTRNKAVTIRVTLYFSR